MASISDLLFDSPDPIAPSPTDIFSSPLRNRRAASNTPKHLLGTSKGNIRLQDFYLTTPPANVSRVSSPTRSIAEAENILSPWRIRVRVEAERDEMPDPSATPSRSPQKHSRTGAGRTATFTVPLKDGDDMTPSQQKKRGRPRKSTGGSVTTRNGTPNPKMRKIRGDEPADDMIVLLDAEADGLDMGSNELDNQPGNYQGVEKNVKTPRTSAATVRIAKSNLQRRKGTPRFLSAPQVDEMTDDGSDIPDVILFSASKAQPTPPQTSEEILPSEWTPGNSKSRQHDTSKQISQLKRKSATTAEAASLGIESVTRSMDGMSKRRKQRRKALSPMATMATTYLEPVGSDELGQVENSDAFSVHRSLLEVQDIGSQILSREEVCSAERFEATELPSCTRRAPKSKIVDARLGANSRSSAKKRPSPRRADPTDEHNEFDSIMESEEFSIVTIGSLASAQQLGLSQKSEARTSILPANQLPMVSSSLEDLRKQTNSNQVSPTTTQPSKKPGSSSLDKLPISNTRDHEAESDHLDRFQETEDASASQSRSFPTIPTPAQLDIKTSSRSPEGKGQGPSPSWKVYGFANTRGPQRAHLMPINANASPRSFRNSGPSKKTVSSDSSILPEENLSLPAKQYSTVCKLGEDATTSGPAVMTKILIAEDPGRHILRGSGTIEPPKDQSPSVVQPHMDYPDLASAPLPTSQTPRIENDEMSWRLDTPQLPVQLPSMPRYKSDSALRAAEAEWQRERDAISEQIQEAKSTDVVVISEEESRGSTTTQEEDPFLCGDGFEDFHAHGEPSISNYSDTLPDVADSTVDIWQAEAQSPLQHPSKIGYNTPRPEQMVRQSRVEDTRLKDARLENARVKEARLKEARLGDPSASMTTSSSQDESPQKIRFHDTNLLKRFPETSVLEARKRFKRGLPESTIPVGIDSSSERIQKDMHRSSSGDPAPEFVPDSSEDEKVLTDVSQDTPSEEDGEEEQEGDDDGKQAHLNVNQAGARQQNREVEDAEYQMPLQDESELESEAPLQITKSVEKRVWRNVFGAEYEPALWLKDQARRRPSSRTSSRIPQRRHRQSPQALLYRRLSKPIDKTQSGSRCVSPCRDSPQAPSQQIPCLPREKNPSWLSGIATFVPTFSPSISIPNLGLRERSLSVSHLLGLIPRLDITSWLTEDEVPNLRPRNITLPPIEAGAEQFPSIYHPWTTSHYIHLNSIYHSYLRNPFPCSPPRSSPSAAYHKRILTNRGWAHKISRNECAVADDFLARLARHGHDDAPYLDINGHTAWPDGSRAERIGADEVVWRVWTLWCGRVMRNEVAIRGSDALGKFEDRQQWRRSRAVGIARKAGWVGKDRPEGGVVERRILDEQ